MIYLVSFVRQTTSNSKINYGAGESRAGARYTKSIASLKLHHKEHNNDPYFLHNNTIDFTQ